MGEGWRSVCFCFIAAAGCQHAVGLQYVCEWPCRGGRGVSPCLRGRARRTIWANPGLEPTSLMSPAWGRRVLYH